LIAKVWAQRLKGYIVIAANEDFIPGMVSFSVRAPAGTNLRDFMAHFADIGSEIGHGHETATGGILTKHEFRQFLRHLGFGPDIKAAA
jgi:hypothetical protein